LELQKTPPPPGAVTSFYPKIASVTAVDKYTVRVAMAEPDATMLWYLAWGRYYGIIPKGLYDRMDLRTKADGTRPFRLEEYVPNGHLKWTCCSDYWDPRVPYFNENPLKVMKDDKARVAQLRRGAIDRAFFTPKAAATRKGDQSLTVRKGLPAVFR